MKTGKMLNSQTYNSRQGLTVGSDGHAVSCSLVTHCRCNTSWVWRTSRLFVVEAIYLNREEYSESESWLWRKWDWLRGIDYDSQKEKLEKLHKDMDKKSRVSLCMCMHMCVLISV